MRGLYALVDTDALGARGLDPLRFAEAVLRARPAALQLRDKRGGARGTLALLRQLAPLARAARVPLFANDRPDLALLAGVDGVHVGQDDVPPALVKAISQGALRVGLSTHREVEVRATLGEPIDYLALGPLLPTASKERPDEVVGWTTFERIAALVRAERPDLPLVAIGGINLEVAPRVAELAALGAVIGALLPESGAETHWPEEVESRARALHRALGGAAT
jgi:thiamine-phosphate pyrophosphorylase